MKKILLVAVLILSCVAFAFSQTRPRLGVLSFYGGTAEEGDMIASLFAMQSALLQNFTVVSRTAAALDAIYAEHGFQMTGLTDSDTIATIGDMLDAQYMLTGSTRRLGALNLLIVTIINVETFELVAGYYRTYGALGEIIGFLPSIAQNLADATLRHQPGRDSLAIVPFAVGAGINPDDVYTLVQILSIRLLDTGYYAVLPRTSAVNAAMAEHGFHMDGHVSAENMALLGMAANARYVLSGMVSRTDVGNMFIVQILRVEDRSVIVGTNRDYRVITEGMGLMSEIATLLTDEGARTEEQRRLYEIARQQAEARAEMDRIAAEARADADRIAAEARAREEAAERARLERLARREERREARRERMGPLALFFDDEIRRSQSIRNEVEWLSFFFCWEAGGDGSRGVGSSVVPILIPSGIYFSPVPYLSLGFETRWTSLSNGNSESLRGAAFSVGTIIAVDHMIRGFANALFEMGNFGSDRDGIIVDGVTPGFDMGLSFNLPTDMLEGVSLNVKYRCILFRGGRSFHSVGVGVSLRFRTVVRYFELVRDLF